jgi:type II secretory pathway component PulF
MSPVKRAVLFSVLARYHEAGLTLDTALLEYSKQEPSLRKSASRAASLVRGGMPLDKAGLAARLLQPWEARLLAIGACHGNLNLALSEVARHYEQSSNWWRQFRSRLLLPAAVLILGWLILPLPKLISGELSVFAYLAGNGFIVDLLWLAWRWMALKDGYPSFLDKFLDQRVPAGKLLWAYHRSKFLNALALLLEAGVPAREALLETANSCRSSKLRTVWQETINSLDDGDTLASTLKTHRVLDATGYSLVDSGEASGKLVQMLKHERDRLADDLRLKLDILAEWLPRVIYVLVLLLLFNRVMG